MGRRCRHISWKAFGAAQAFDARQITGVSDGSTVETWTDLGTGGNNASQSDSARRPVYRTGANGLNNGPVLQFNGSDDQMTHSFANSTASAAQILLAFGTTALTPPSTRHIYFTTPANQVIRIGANNDHEANANNKWWFVGYNYDGGAANLSDSSLTPSTVISSYDGSQYNVAINGSWEPSATAGAGYSDSFDRTLIGGETGSSNQAACKIAMCCTVQPSPSRALLNRLSHSFSRSYKLASS